MGEGVQDYSVTNLLSHICMQEEGVCTVSLDSISFSVLYIKTNLIMLNSLRHSNQKYVQCEQIENQIYSYIKKHGFTNFSSIEKMFPMVLICKISPSREFLCGNSVKLKNQETPNLMSHLNKPSQPLKRGLGRSTKLHNL